MLAHHQRLNLRAGIVGVSVAAPDERCICAEHASRADVRSRAFPAASWRTRALHIRSKLITHSAAHGNDLCSSKIAVVSVISGMNEGARYCIAHVLLHRYFMAPPVSHNAAIHRGRAAISLKRSSFTQRRAAQMLWKHCTKPE